jgi:hypothetical protein
LLDRYRFLNDTSDSPPNFVEVIAEGRDSNGVAVSGWTVGTPPSPTTQAAYQPLPAGYWKHTGNPTGDVLRRIALWFRVRDQAGLANPRLAFVLLPSFPGQHLCEIVAEIEGDWNNGYTADLVLLMSGTSGITFAIHYGTLPIV